MVLYEGFKNIVLTRLGLCLISEQTQGYVVVAGPEGFEPSFSGSEGRCLDPGWATDPVCIEVWVVF